MIKHPGTTPDFPLILQNGTTRNRSLERESYLMAWFYLVTAGVFEIVWAYFMKQSDGFTRLTPTIITLVTMIISFSFLALAMRSLPLGTAYAIWTGIGTIGAFAIGIVFLAEPVTLLRLGSAALIICGLVGLKLSSSV
jgi:quaternary ammonium compound-resistance protein SugE